jgi:formiminotetrahydrofolate cyclodeaminase
MTDESITTWLSALAAKQPTPGGGAVAALSASLAAALVGMVSIYTTGSKWQQQTERMEVIHTLAADLREQSLELVAADATAFSRVGMAYKLPKDNDEQRLTRQASIQEALIGAAEPPRLVAALTVRIIDLLEELTVAGNPNVISDVAVGASNARAALEAAIVNVEINKQLIEDDAVQGRLARVIADAEAAIVRTDKVVLMVRDRIQTT